MSNKIKNQVLDFLAKAHALPEDKFNEAFKLYSASENKNHFLERRMNQTGYTPEFLDHLVYELKNLHDISDVELEDHRLNVLAEKEVSDNTEVAEVTTTAQATTAEAKTTATTESVTADATAAAAAEATTTDTTEAASTEVTQETTETTEETVDDEKSIDDAEAKEKVQSMVDTVEGANSLREEFPFLNNPDCPEILFIVVGKKLSAYKAWQAAQEKMQQIKEGHLTVEESEQLKTAQDAEAFYKENQALWEELDHYKQTGKILGKHELFWQSNAKKEVDVMTTDELAKYRNSSAKFFSTQKANLTKNKDNAEKVAEINAKIEQRTYKLSLVNAKLGGASDSK